MASLLEIIRPLNFQAIVCAAVTKSGIPCKNFVRSRENKFCNDHQFLAAPKAPASNTRNLVNAVPGKCMATNSKGKPCKAKPNAGEQLGHFLLVAYEASAVKLC